MPINSNNRTTPNFQAMSADFNARMTQLHGGRAADLRHERSRAILGARAIAFDPAPKKSIRTRVTSFFRAAAKTLSPFKYRKVSVVVDSGKPAATPSLKKAISEWHAGSLDSRAKKILRGAEKSNPDGAKTFSAFLTRLNETPSAENPMFRQHVDIVLQGLIKSPALLEQGFLIATNATGTCDDGVTRTFNQLQLASVIHDMDNGKFDRHVAMALKIATGIFKLECIETISERTVKIQLDKALASPTLQTDLEVDARKFAGMSNADKKDKLFEMALVDPVEINMDYQVSLNKPCRIVLPAPAMEHGAYSNLEVSDIEAAAAEVNQRVKENFSAWLTKLAPWERLMQRVAPEQHAAMLQARDDKLEEVTSDADRLIAVEIQRMNPEADSNTIAYLMNDPATRDRVERDLVDRAIATVQIPFHMAFAGDNKTVA